MCIERLPIYISSVRNSSSSEAPPPKGGIPKEATHDPMTIMCSDPCLPKCLAFDHSQSFLIILQGMLVVFADMCRDLEYVTLKYATFDILIHF